jgi:hypothetical protein
VFLNLDQTVLPVVLIFLGLFGIAHNRQLCRRYDNNEERLIEVAKQLDIRAVFHEKDCQCCDRKRYNLDTMRVCFYGLYVGTILVGFTTFVQISVMIRLHVDVSGC